MNDFATFDQVASLPDTPQGCRALLAHLHDEVRSIRIEISTRDLRRQAEKVNADPDWYHRASTALRHKRREIAMVQLQLERLLGPTRRDGLKDVLISVLREDYDDVAWSRAMSRARKLHEQVMGVSHD
jgi:hypothetical protein